MNRVRPVEDAVKETIRSGQTLMVGGFGRGGTPFTILEVITDRADDYEDLTIIKNDANEPDLGVGALIKRGMVKKLVSTHIGLNPEAVQMMNDGDLDIEFSPQGIFAERIRAGGAGIPAFLSDIGLDTVIAEGKQTMEFDGKTCLLEKALRGDVALLCADIVDESGNCWWRGSNRNMNPMMGMACETVIVEAREIVETGSMEPENIHLPSAFVDIVIQAQERRHILEGRIN